MIRRLDAWIDNNGPCTVAERARVFAHTATVLIACLGLFGWAPGRVCGGLAVVLLLFLLLRQRAEYRCNVWMERLPLPGDGSGR